MPENTCATCKEHSGFQERLIAGEKAMEKMEYHMEEQTKMTFKILIGVILCLFASLASFVASISLGILARQIGPINNPVMNAIAEIMNYGF